MFKLEPRPQASRLWTYGSPLLAFEDHSVWCFQFFSTRVPALV